MTKRIRLRREDGKVFLDRWGWEHKKIGGIFLHKMSAPDPGVDLHDHPWTFVSFIVAGGYTEQRARARDAAWLANLHQGHPIFTPGTPTERKRWSFKMMHLDECHRITDLRKRHSWSIVIHGPWIRPWGFFIPTLPNWINNFVSHEFYDKLNRRTLHTEKATPQ